MTATSTAVDAPADDTARSRSAVLIRVAPWVWGALLFAAYTTLSLARYHRLGTQSWDTAIFVQIIDSYAHFDAPVIDIKGPGFNALGDHFSPLVAVFAPFYALFPAPETLFVGQALLVALSAVVVMSAAIKHLGTGAGIAVGVAYGLSFGLQAGVDAEFHEYALAVPLLALAGHAWLDKRWGRVTLWTCLLLLVKEDLGLTVAMMGLALLLVGVRRWGTVCIAAGLAGFALTTLVIIPAVSPDGSYLYWSRFDEGGSDAGLWQLVSTLWTPGIKVETALITLGVTGFLVLRSPLVLLLLPNLAMRFVGNVEFYWGLDWHYAMPIMPVLFLGVVDAIVRIRADGPGWLRAYARQVPAVTVAVALTLLLQTPLRDLVRPETYADSPREPAAEVLLSQIPEGASVETDIGLITQLSADHEVYWIGNAAQRTPDYVVIDAQAGWGTPPANVATYAESLHPGIDYERVFSRDGYSLAARIP